MLTLDDATSKVQQYAPSEHLTTVGDIEFFPVGENPYVDFRDDEGDTQSLGLRDALAVKSLLGVIGVPIQALTEYRDDSELLSSMFTSSRRRRESEKLRVLVRNNEILKVEPDLGMPKLGVLEVWDRIRQLPDVHHVESVSVTGHGLDARIISGFSDNPVSCVDDVSHAGVLVRSNGHTEVIPYFQRLVCTNGMQVYSDMRPVLADVEDSTSVLSEKFDNALRFGWDASRAAVQKFCKSDDEQIDNPSQFLTRLLRDAGISNKHVAELISIVPELVRSTTYTLMNLITSYAQQQNGAVRDKLERVAYAGVDRKDHHTCAQCHSVLN